ncbi:Choline-sulfatase [Caulifigura coniformis]|uniref:Choline-sulfatase n=1 Tax=Caulifigura coniformis TaxID=2527983 RepID=A0A517S8Z2_9PLAN|nr:sulfatase [Caulifigura coniformis]QDT52579.1 Choline-sulfatase [Caulifigura coniformis]
MTNRSLFVLALWCLLTAMAPAADGKRPNVLFIISDDLNNLLGCYGDPLAKTPNLDRLAARGVLFDKAYCTFPLCGPSRNSLLTGLYPNSTGIIQNSQIFRQTIPNQLSMPQAFRQAGYFAGRIGKLYHYNVPNSIGTNGHDDPGSWELELNPAGVDRLDEHPHIFSLTPKQFGGTLSWYASPQPDEKHTDGLEAEDAQWVLERCAKKTDRPFFLAVGFFRPHTPYVAPKKYFDMHPAASMPVVQGVKEDQADIPPAGLGSYKKEQDKLTDDLRRETRQAYNASISFMDAQVGKVVDSLDRLGLSDNTIIVFTSDHGYHMGEHGLWQKMSIFEESARVPLLIVAPGAKKGSIAKSPVSHLDLFPTLAELCGVTPPSNIQGQSLAPMLKDPSATGRGWALTQVMRGGGRNRASVATNVGADGKRFFGYSLRTPRWRYTEWDEGHQGRELYDHEADPKELTNLAERSEHAKTIEELSKTLREAAKASFPPSGTMPTLNEGPLWPPLLVDP